MQHSMKLLPIPFAKILNGTKTIEFRLNDEKRRQIQIGDTITFHLMPDLKESITVEVLDLYTEPTFKDLFYKYMQDEKEIQETLDIVAKIYSKEDEEKYGALGIKIKVIN